MHEWDILTPEDIKTIQDSYAKLADRHQETGDYLYKHLFDCCPDVVNIFKTDMKEQSRTLMKMVKTVVEGLNHTHIIMPAIQDLGHRHHELGITQEQYKYFKESLLFAVEKVLGKDFNENVKNSWTKLYDVLENLMKGNRYN
ncbi:MAG: globin domain-containing protein [Ignavibacteria bacterium]|nr:globin domain-containing protein [Ignavibacteria bacterium]